MTAVFLTHPVESRYGPARRRFALTLAISALLHLYAVKTVVVEMPSDRARPAAAASIQVRLEPVSPPLALEPVTVPAGAQPTRTVAGARQAVPVKNEANPVREEISIALRPPPDPVYYPAGELDSYPRPVAPLKLGHPAGIAPDGTSGRAQLMLQINEHGTVDRVSIVEAEPRGQFEDELRAALIQTQFLPALKDGRPVKSRILLSISFAAASEEQSAAPKGW